MSQELNVLGQPVGFVVPNWSPPKFPPYQVMEGRFCKVAPLVPDRDAASLYEANSLDKDGRMWTYLPYGPFASFD